MILGLNHNLNISLIIIETIIILGFILLYLQRKNKVIVLLIWSVGLFLASNALHLLSLFLQGSSVSEFVLFFFAALATSGGAILLLSYFEMFEHAQPYTKRTTIAIVLIMLTTLFQVLGYLKFYPLVFLGLTPVPYVIIGVMYLIYTKSIRMRVQIESQIKKISQVSSGILMIFFLPVVVYSILFTQAIIAMRINEEISIQLFERTATSFNILSIDTLALVPQLIGIVLISLPIFTNKSINFMQTRRLLRLIVINESGLPLYHFDFNRKKKCDELLLSGALTAVQAIIKEATGTSQALQAISFGDLHIQTEVRKRIAVNLILEAPSAFLKESLRLFTDDIISEVKNNGDITEVDYNLLVRGNELIQKYFGLEQQDVKKLLPIQKQRFFTSEQAPNES